VITYCIAAALTFLISVIKDSPALTRWWFNWFILCGLEPFVSFILSFVAFKSYEDCRDIVPSRTSDVMCLDGSDIKYGKYGTTIVGANDSERRVFFWVNLATSFLTMIFHGALFEGAMEEHDTEEFEAEEDYESEQRHPKYSEH
jgi:hypothetical protein